MTTHTIHQSGVRRWRHLTVGSELFLDGVPANAGRQFRPVLDLDVLDALGLTWHLVVGRRRHATRLLRLEELLAVLADVQSRQRLRSRWLSVPRRWTIFLESARHNIKLW